MKIKLMFFTGMMLILLSGCASLDNKTYREVTMGFEHEGNQLSASVILPENSSGPFPVVVFVHGDGAMPYDAYGYYRPLWNRLAKQGIASFSWDKPGVGRSQGDWQNQSLDNRADETIAAIDMLKKHTNIVPNKIGLIGYSQAGWVLPLVAKKSDYPNFMILVSTAINWMNQGAYMMKERLTQKGVSDKQIKEAIELYRSTSVQFFAPSTTYEEYRQYYHANTALKMMGEALLTPQRFQFVKLNWRYDAQESLKKITAPTLAIFGKHDLNVDTQESIRVYKTIFEKSGNNDVTIKLFPDAQHSLLKQKHFKETVPGIGFLIKLEFLGKDAFAEGYLDFVADWVEEKNGNETSYLH
ncbi:MAG: alpha/beta hydrolase [Gammaproteobacteria bacterium]|nr:alpha/beta hydrolase [Gammaproteobacteria bacterium]